MKLNEALDILESNNYICEFLNHSVSKEKLQRLIEKKFRLFLKDCSKERGLYANSIIDSKQGCSFTALNRSSLTSIADNLAKFVKKYGWYLRDINGDTICLEAIYDLRKDSNDECYFTHISYAPPKIILKTGLRLRTNTNSEKRIYLCKHKNKNELNYSDINSGIPKESEDNNYHYMYLIKLPKNIPIYIDPEYGEEDNAYFVEVPIQPKYITYVGYTNY